MIKEMNLDEKNKLNRNNNEFTLENISGLIKGEYNPYFIIKGDSSNNKYNIKSDNTNIKINIYEKENDIYEITVNDCNYYNDKDFSVTIELKDYNSLLMI